MIGGYSQRELATIRVAVRLYLAALDAMAHDFTQPRTKRADANHDALEVHDLLDKLNRERVQ